MALFFQILVNSIVVGSLYGAIAMSFALAYRTTRFFNLAHGSMAAVGGYAFFSLSQMVGLHLVISLLGGIVVAASAGYLIDRFIYAWQRRRKASSAVLLIVSLGVVTVVESVLAIGFGTQFRALVRADQISSFQIGSAFITLTQIWIVLVNILMFIGLLLLLRKTKFGKIIRAIADDPEVARILGIRSDFYIGAVSFLTAGLAGLVGILMGLDTGIQPTMGFYLLLKGIIAGIIGCAASVPGAFFGGFILALAENAGIFVVGSEWRDAIAFVLLLVFLAFRPQGILGKDKG